MVNDFELISQLDLRDAQVLRVVQVFQAFRTPRQTIPLEMRSEIKDDSGLWAATDTVQTPMGVVTDTTMLEKRTLIPREHHVKQGPVCD